MPGRNLHPHRRAVRGKLVDRDYEILMHLSAYRVTTREVLHGLFFEDSEVNAVSKVTTRLQEGGFLASHDLGGGTNRVYFTVGPTGCVVLGIPKRRTKPVGSQALLTDLALLGFCHGSDFPGERKRLPVSELARKVPALVRSGMDATRYVLEVEPGGARRIVFVRVDHGGDPTHLVRRLTADAEKRRAVPELKTLMDADQFRFAVVTGHPAKVVAIRDRLARRRWPVKLRVEAVPTILPLLADLPG